MKYIVIEGDFVIGSFDSESEAMAAADILGGYVIEVDEPLF